MDQNSTASASSGEAQPGQTPKKKHRGVKITAWTVGAVVVVAGGAYVAGALLTQDKLPSHLSIDGVDVSGQKLGEAKTTLTDAFGQRAEKQIKLTTGNDDTSASIKPSDAGLAVDVSATLDKYTGMSWDPTVIWSRLTGSEEGAAKTTVDHGKLNAAMKTVAGSLDSKPTEGNISFDEGKVNLTDPHAGLTLDKQETGQRLSQQWVNSEGTVSASVKKAEPQVSADAWKNFADTTAKDLVAGPVTVDDGSNQAELTAAQLGAAASVETKDGKPSLKLDADALLRDTVAANAKMKSTGKDASFKLTGTAGNSKPEVVPAHEGRGIKAADLAKAVTQAIGNDARKATVKPSVTQPTISTDTAKKWKLEVTSEFATDYPTYDTVRTKNLRAGSGKVNGTVIMPGKEFNLANRFGPVTAANGYFSSGVVENGLSTKAMGGGLSQIATMSYNAGFLSGMEILEHRPHSRWFDRYPAGRESTYWEGQINVRWKNDTPAPVAVEMWVSDNKVHMRTWGVKYWDVKTSTSDHYNITNPQTKHSSAPGCVPEHTGIKGFTVDVTRERTAPGKKTEKTKDTTTYQAWPNVNCG